jgi:hypothetical protein
MKLKLVIGSVALALAVTSTARAATYVEYYRDNLFLGLAYHRVGCLSNGSTIISEQEYDGFTTYNYCRYGASYSSAPNAQWYDWGYASVAQADSCGYQANTKYGTPNYQSSSNTCSYNIMTDCNSDCWIKKFSSCMGDTTSIASPCWPDNSPPPCDPYVDYYCGQPDGGGGE